MSRNTLDYRLETLSGEPLKSSNLGIDNEVINVSSELKNGIKKIENKIAIDGDNPIDLLKIVIIIFILFFLLGFAIWILKLIGKLPEEIENLITNLVNSIKSLFYKKDKKDKKDKESNTGPVVGVTAPPAKFKEVTNSQINDGNDVPDETQVNDTNLPEPGSNPRVVSNAQTWVEGKDPREVTRSQISIPPTPLPQQGNPEPVDTLDNRDSKKSAGYCYIGEDRGFRSCIYVNDYNKCLSGQVFPNEALCLNPNLR